MNRLTVMISIGLFLSISSNTFSQIFGYDKDPEVTLNEGANNWFEGSILLEDGTELKGLVKYDMNLNVLSYMNGNDSRSFTPRSVDAFELFDEEIQKQRLFYSLMAEDLKTKIRRNYFFELIKDFPDFAVLVQASPLEVKERSLNSSPSLTPMDGRVINNNAYGRSVIVLKHTETIFFMRAGNDPEPYTSFIVQEDGIISLFTGDDEKRKKKIHEKDLIADYIPEPAYSSLKSYAKENNLSFKKKEDLLKLFDYYETLVNI